MIKLILRRIGFGLLALIGSSFFIFVITDLMPGDYATAVLGRGYTEETAVVIREKLGLYLPLISRYLLWLGDMAVGEFGLTFSGYEIGPVVEIRIQRSMWLAMVTGLFAFPIAIALGVYSALHRHTTKDRAIISANTVMVSIPEFLVGYALVAVFAVYFDIFPSLALFRDDDPLGTKLYSVTLPVIALSFVAIPPVMRLVRASLVNTLNSDYVEMAVLKGISPNRIMLFHALPNNMGVIINAITLGFANLIAGIVIIEIVFVFPGIGSLFVDAISIRNVPVIQACGVILASCYIILIMVADVIAIASNPRLIAKQQMALLHPGQIMKGMKYAPVIILLGLSVYLFQFIPEKPPLQTQSYGTQVNQPDLSATRTYGIVTELLDSDFEVQGLVHNANFMVLGEVHPSWNRFNGAITISSEKILGQRAGGVPRYGFGEFPDATIEFVTWENFLLPVDQGFIETGTNDWAILVEPGRIWQETADENYSRASFPFALVNKNGADAHQGIGMFVFDDNTVSNLRYQIVQESSRSRKFTAWGQLDLEFSPRNETDSEKVKADFLKFSKTNLPRKPWSNLSDQLDNGALDEFDGIYHQGNVSSSGLIIDGTIYQKECQTVMGPYPFCESMRHSVYSVTKTLGAAISLARLAQKYGDEVLNARILDYVNIRAAHDGWENVTFRHALNMATGIGDLVPERVNYYVDPDEMEEASWRVFREPTSVGKIREIGRFKNYPWGPGEVLRYRTIDTFVLSYAMDRFLKSMEGDNAMLWEMMNREVFQPIGIPWLPVVHTRDQQAIHRIPKLGYAMVPTTDDISKLVKLLRNGGRHDDVQLLSSSVVDEMMNVNAISGLPSGWEYREGGEARYHMSMWLIPYEAVEGCHTTMTAMVGVGGNYVIPMPNGITAFRLADRYEDHPGTYDSYQMRRISDKLRSVCDSR